MKKPKKAIETLQDFYMASLEVGKSATRNGFAVGALMLSPFPLNAIVPLNGIMSSELATTSILAGWGLALGSVGILLVSTGKKIHELMPYRVSMPDFNFTTHKNIAANVPQKLVASAAFNSITGTTYSGAITALLSEVLLALESPDKVSLLLIGGSVTLATIGCGANRWAERLREDAGNICRHPTYANSKVELMHHKL